MTVVTPSDWIRAWTRLVMIFLLALPLVLYLLEPQLWLVVYPLVLVNLEVLALIAIATALYYHVREGKT